MIMKKVSLLLCLALASLVVSAQETYEKKAVFKNNGFWDNWFIGAGARGNVYFGDGDDEADFLNRPSLNGALMVGKWFSPKIGARLGVEGGSLHHFTKKSDVMNHQQYIGAHVDALFNVTNMLCGYNPTRFYNFIPYVGIGYAHGFDKDWNSVENNTATFNAGFLNTFRLSKRLSAYVEISGSILDDDFDLQPGGDWNWDGMLGGTAGLILNLGSTTTFVPVDVQDQGLIDDLNSRINRLKAENDVLRKRPEYCPECPDAPAPIVQSEGTFVPSVVFFRINSANIDANQQINIFNTAEYLKANSNAKVKIVGYADKKTGTAAYNDKLSEKRAKNVANALIKKYNISSDRVTVEWKGASEQPYKENAWNRVAIFFAD